MEQHCQHFILFKVEVKCCYNNSLNTSNWKSKKRKMKNENEKKTKKIFRSEQDQRLYIVRDNFPDENFSASASLFDQLNLFDNSNDPFKRSVRRKCRSIEFFFIRFETFRKALIIVVQQSIDFRKLRIFFVILYSVKMISS